MAVLPGAMRNAFYAQPMPVMPGGAFAIYDFDTTSYSALPAPCVRNKLNKATPRSSYAASPRRNFNNSSHWIGTGLTITDATATAWDGSSDASIITAASGSWVLRAKYFYGASGTYTIGFYVRWRGTGNPQFKMGNITTSTFTTKTATSSWARFSVSVTADIGEQVGLATADALLAADFEVIDGEIFAGASDLGPEPLDMNLYFARQSSGGAPDLSGGFFDVATDAGKNVAYFQTPQVKVLKPFTVAYLAKRTGDGANADLFQVVVANMRPETSDNSFTIGPAVVNTFGRYYSGTNALDPSKNVSKLLDSIGRGFFVGAHTYDNTTYKVYCNGAVIDQAAFSASGPSVSDFYLGTVQSTNYAGCQIARAALYDRALSADEIEQVGYISSIYARSNSITVEPSRTVYFIGDSLTYGNNATANHDYAALTAEQCVPIIRASNQGIVGANCSTQLALVSTYGAMIPANKRGRQYVAFVFLGANDMSPTGPNVSGAQFATNYAALCDALRADGFDKIVGATVLSRCDAGDSGVAFDAKRTIANPLIRAMVGTTLDALADFAAIPVLGANGAFLNPTYSDDQVHGTNAAYALMAPVAAAAINGVWSY